MIRSADAQLELDDADRAVLIALLKQVIAADPFTQSPRTKMLRGILRKLQSPLTRPEQSGQLTNKKHKPR